MCLCAALISLTLPSDCDCLEEMAVVAAMLCVESVFFAPMRPKEPAAPAPERAESRVVFKGVAKHHGTHSANRSFGPQFDEESRRVEAAHSQLRHPYGDHLTLLAVFNAWQEAGCSVQWCERNYINFRSMNTARKIRCASPAVLFCRLFLLRQHLQSSIQQAGLVSASRPMAGQQQQSLEKRICDAVTAGYFMNAAVKCTNDSVFKYVPLGEDSDRATGSGSSRDVHMLHMHPSSVFAQQRPPEHVVFQDLVHSSKVFMKQVVRASRSCLRAHQSRWRRVTAGQLCGRVDIAPELTSEPIKSEVSFDGKHSETNVGTKRPRDITCDRVSGSGSTTIISDVADAKQRYLARKAGK